MENIMKRPVLRVRMYRVFVLLVFKRVSRRMMDELHVEGIN
jgi:hypothetical protein